MGFHASVRNWWLFEFALAATPLRDDPTDHSAEYVRQPGLAALIAKRRRIAGRPFLGHQTYENSFVTGLPVTIRDGRLVKSS
jgi:hypothetical protein